MVFMFWRSDVTAVIYCASLSGYDESMYEDEMANVMHDSLDVFEEHVVKIDGLLKHQ